MPQQRAPWADFLCCGKAKAEPNQNSATAVFRKNVSKGERVMFDKFTFSSAGEVQEVEFALARACYTHPEVKELSKGDLLGQVRQIILGQAVIKPVAEDATREITLNETTIVVNLGAAPKLPFNGAEVESHAGEGWAIVEKSPDGLYVNGRKVVLHLSRRQQNGKSLKGYELREELTGKPVLNANLLDTLADNSHLIPEDWKKDEQGNTRYIFFWGTIYRSSRGHLCVRYLYFHVGMWDRYYDWLDYDWHGSRPAALLASSRSLDF